MIEGLTLCGLSSGGCSNPPKAGSLATYLRVARAVESLDSKEEKEEYTIYQIYSKVRFPVYGTSSKMKRPKSAICIYSDELSIINSPRGENTILKVVIRARGLC